MSSIWDRCLTKLENEIHSGDLNTWIRPLQAIEQGGNLRLLAPNRFIIEHIKQHYLAEIKDVVSEFSNGNLLLQFEIGSKDASSQIQSTLSSKPTKYKQNNKTKPIKQSNFLNKTFTFSNFVEGRSNQLARASAIQVAENVCKSYNPLFIYGGSGLGKTHLMHAIGNAVIKTNPNANIVYLHSEKFIRDMVLSFQHNTINEFKNYYRSIEILLIDDIQFLAGKERSQEEFFHTFNSILDKKHQIVLTSDKYPREIPGMDERLKTRFGSGLPVVIESPDLEMRAAILIKKSNLVNVKLSQEVAFFISKRIPSNVRDLEGALRRVIASAEFTGSEITIDFTKEALRDLISLQDRLISIEDIQKKVAEYFKIRVADLSLKSRKQTVTRPRQIAMCLARDLTSYSFPEIGDVFGGRSHTTVINACKRINELKYSNVKISEDYNNLLRILS